MPFTQDIIDKFKKSDEELNKFHYVLGKDLDPDILKDVMGHSCGEHILPSYIEDTMNAVLHNPNFHMVAMFKTETFNIENILGFIVLQLGECELLPNSYSINLICSHQSKGKILMGLALYAIKTNENVQDKTCVLELAGGYINTVGFCMYSKFGFVANTQLYASDCFSDANNLPMSVMLDDISATEIVKRSITSFETSDPICKSKARTKQVYLGMAMNLKTRLDLMYRRHFGEDDLINFEPPLNKSHRYLYTTYNYNRLFENCKKKKIDVDSLIQIIEDAANVSDFIKYFNGSIINHKIKPNANTKNETQKSPARVEEKRQLRGTNHTNTKKRSRSRSRSRSISVTMSRNRSMNDRSRSQIKKRHRQIR